MRDVQTDLSSVLIYVYVRALIRLGLSVGLSVCKKECIHVRKYVCMCEHLSVCMYVFAYSYIHTVSWKRHTSLCKVHAGIPVRIQIDVVTI